MMKSGKMHASTFMRDLVAFCPDNPSTGSLRVRAELASESRTGSARLGFVKAQRSLRTQRDWVVVVVVVVWVIRILELWGRFGF